MSAFAVAKIGMKLKEKAQKTQKKSLSPISSTKDQMTSTKNGIEEQNEISTSSNIAATKAPNNSTPVSISASTTQPTKITVTGDPSTGKKFE